MKHNPDMFSNAFYALIVCKITKLRFCCLSKAKDANKKTRGNITVYNTFSVLDDVNVFNCI